jgi:hypothetical protein
MAIMIPNRITADRRATPGEKKTFEILASGLDKSWYVWYDVGIGNKESYPDFILIHPNYGLLVLEVKDFHFSDLKKISKDRFISRSRTHLNPLRQARNYIFDIIDDHRLTAKPPYQYAVVFPNISSEQLYRPINGVSISEIISPKRILSKRDLKESQFPAVLINLVKENRSTKRMSLALFNSLRLIIDPSLSIPLVSQSARSSKGKRSVILIDQVQERIAKGTGEGHRLLRGVAGSGKTLIMLYRAKILSRLNPDWKILFICWNRSLINYLEQLFEAIKMNSDSKNVEFNYYSRWLKGIGKEQHVSIPNLADYKKDIGKYTSDYESVIKELIQRDPATQYQAVLIDEGQDFEDDYYRLLLNHLDPKTNSLLICYDIAQNIYKRKSSWKKLGISATGKRTIQLGDVEDQLVRNYRNTWEVTRFSKLLYNDLIPDKDENDNHLHIKKLSGRLNHGPPPYLHLLYDRQEEYEFVISWITNIIINEKLDFSDFVIIYPGKRIRDFDVELGLLPAMNNANLPVNWISENQYSKSQFNFSENSIKVSTVASAKGMDFEACIVVACDCIMDDEPEVSLYVAATRARKFLLFTSGGRNHSVKRILESSFDKLMSVSKG